MAEFSLWPLLDQLWITDKHLRQHRLGDVKTWAQQQLGDEVDRQLRAKRPVRIIVLKARQMGISTLIEGIQFVSVMVRPGMNGLVLSHENKSSEHLLGICRHYWTTWEYAEFYETRYVSRNTLAWEGTGSQIQVATAGNEAAGRSRTLQFLHASEVGFWKDAAVLMTGMNQSIPQGPGSFIFLESTANGVGNYFHQTWEAAEAGDVDYVPMFFPWHKHPEYRASVLGLPVKALGPLDEEERLLSGMLRSDGLDDSDIADRLWWRRWAIPNLCQGDVLKFKQEYPATPEEAFVATGTNVFPARDLADAYDEVTPAVGRLQRDRYQQVQFVEDPDGPMHVYAYPGERAACEYVIGGDPTVGLRGDYAVMQVVNRYTWEQVATWRSRIDPLRFADQMVMAGEWYNNALLAPEANKSGEAVIARILTVGYPNMFRHHKSGNVRGQMAESWGFRSNLQTKPAAIANLLSAITQRNLDGRPFLILHDAKTYAEMRNFIHLPGDRFGNSAAEAHDDTVMALAIALTATMETAMVTPGLSPLAPTAIPAGLGRPDRYYQLDGNLVGVPKAAPDWLTSDRFTDPSDMFTGDTDASV